MEQQKVYRQVFVPPTSKKGTLLLTWLSINSQIKSLLFNFYDNKSNLKTQRSSVNSNTNNKGIVGEFYYEYVLEAKRVDKDFLNDTIDVMATNNLWYIDLKLKNYISTTVVTDSLKFDENYNLVDIQLLIKGKLYPTPNV